MDDTARKRVPDREGTEEWRPVVGYEGLYEVSDHGRVRSVARVVVMRNGVPRPIRERLLKAHVKEYGHRSVALSKNGVEMTYGVHRLVLLTFGGPPPFPEAATRHIDGDPTNNHPSNLCWGSAADNMADRGRHGRTTMGVDHHLARATPDVVRAIRRRWAAGERQTALAAEYGLTQPSVSSICRRETWKHITDTEEAA